MKSGPYEPSTIVGRGAQRPERHFFGAWSTATTQSPRGWNDCAGSTRSSGELERLAGERFEAHTRMGLPGDSPLVTHRPLGSGRSRSSSPGGRIVPGAQTPPFRPQDDLAAAVERVEAVAVPQVRKAIPSDEWRPSSASGLPRRSANRERTRRSPWSRATHYPAGSKMLVLAPTARKSTVPRSSASPSGNRHRTSVNGRGSPGGGGFAAGVRRKGARHLPATTPARRIRSC